MVIHFRTNELKRKQLNLHLFGIEILLRIEID